MHLYRRRYVKSWDHYPDERKTEITLKIGGQPVELLNPVNPAYLDEEVFYWRKANQIHGWIINN